MAGPLTGKRKDYIAHRVPSSEKKVRQSGDLPTDGDDGSPFKPGRDRARAKDGPNLKHRDDYDRAAALEEERAANRTETGAERAETTSAPIVFDASLLRLLPKDEATAIFERALQTPEAQYLPHKIDLNDHKAIRIEKVKLIEALGVLRQHPTLWTNKDEFSTYYDTAREYLSTLCNLLAIEKERVKVQNTLYKNGTATRNADTSEPILYAADVVANAKTTNSRQLSQLVRDVKDRMTLQASHDQAIGLIKRLQTDIVDGNIDLLGAQNPMTRKSITDDITALTLSINALYVLFNSIRSAVDSAVEKEAQALASAKSKRKGGRKSGKKTDNGADDDEVHDQRCGGQNK